MNPRPALLGGRDEGEQHPISGPGPRVLEGAGLHLGQQLAGEVVCLEGEREQSAAALGAASDGVP
jgi:hypothetical protein